MRRAFQVFGNVGRPAELSAHILMIFRCEDEWNVDGESRLLYHKWFFSLGGLLENYQKCFFIRSPLRFCHCFAMCIFFKVSVLCLSSFLACVLSPFTQPASTLSSQHLLCLSAECFQAGWHHINRLGEGPCSQTHAQTGSFQTCKRTPCCLLHTPSRVKASFKKSWRHFQAHIHKVCSRF